MRTRLHRGLTLSAAAALAVLCVTVPTGPAAAAPRSHTMPIQLLAFNDFHGNLEPPSGSSGLINTTTAGGAEYLATHLKQDVA